MNSFLYFLFLFLFFLHLLESTTSHSRWQVSYRIGSCGSICHTKVNLPQATTQHSQTQMQTQTQTQQASCTTPPPSPQLSSAAKPFAAAPRSPLLPLPLSRRPSEANFAVPNSPSRTASRELMFSPPQQRRLSMDVGRSLPPMGRSPSRPEVYPSTMHPAMHMEMHLQNAFIANQRARAVGEIPVLSH